MSWPTGTSKKNPQLLCIFRGVGAQVTAALHSLTGGGLKCIGRRGKRSMVLELMSLELLD